MPVYHYYATKQLPLGQALNIDGIAVMQKPVLTMEDYRELKKVIAEIDGGGIGGPEGMTICSLTLLQETPNIIVTGTREESGEE